MQKVTIDNKILYPSPRLGYPIPEVTWVKSIGAPLPLDRVSRESYEQELNIRDVQKTDEGTYQCTASNAAGAPQTHTVIVKVASTNSSIFFLL